MEFFFGTGGLVKAYTDSTKEALKKADFITKTLQTKYEVEVPYSYNDKITYFCRNAEYKIIGNKFLENVHILLSIKKEVEESFIKNITEISDRTAIITKISDEFYS